jgi:putative sigma-54 modulation protein
MRIAIKGRNFDVSEDVREKVVKRFGKMGRQVSALAECEVELSEERNPAIRDRHVAEATLYLKGVTLRAVARSDNMTSAIGDCSDELFRQVTKHRDKRRARRPGVKAQGQAAAP